VLDHDGGECRRRRRRIGRVGELKLDGGGFHSDELGEVREVESNSSTTSGRGEGGGSSWRTTAISVEGGSSGGAGRVRGRSR
jgi:hypothetical protein